MSPQKSLWGIGVFYKLILNIFKTQIKKILFLYLNFDGLLRIYLKHENTIHLSRENKIINGNKIYFNLECPMKAREILVDNLTLIVVDFLRL